MASDDLAEAKRRLPLPALLHQLGLGEHAKKSARCPFHEDQHNSFSVWRNDAESWFWKCHAGCGDGDEVTFLEKHKSISSSEAIKLFKEMAGVNAPRSKPASASPPDWRACVEAFTHKHMERLADWRGFSGVFCSWLKQNDLVGLHEGCIAFPVHDVAGKVAAIHYRLRDGSWRYYPPGAKMRPLVIGELVAGDSGHVFESQWDAFAFMDASGERSGIVISRGAANGALVAGLLPENSTVYLWTQNDPAGEKWLRDICANTKAIAKRAKVPTPHKDLNDWTRAGATTENLVAAMTNAEPIGAMPILADETANTPAEPEAETEQEDDLPDFPIECLPPILQRMARAISQLLGVPLAMSAPMVLVAASIVIGAGLRVRSLAGRITPANLFVLVFKTSGSGGTLTYTYATAPLFGMQHLLRKEFDENWKPYIDAQLADVCSQIENYKRRLKKATDEEGERTTIVEELTAVNKRRAALEKCKSRIVLASDVTPEKLAEILAQNAETLGHIDSDAADAIGIITGERYNTETSETVWLKGYSGDPIVIFRKNSEPVHLTRPCLAVLFVATPDCVQELFEDRRLTSGGLLPRFLVCDPRARPMPQSANVDKGHTLPTDVSQAYESAIWAVFAHYGLRADKSFKIDPTTRKLKLTVDGLCEDADRAGDENEPFEIDMTPGARKLAVDDWNRFCAGCDGNEDRPFEARHTENAIRIAVVLHAFRFIRQTQRGPGTFHSEVYAHEQPLDEETMCHALEIRDWFNRHQERLRGSQRADAEEKAWHRAKGLLADRSPAMGITARDFFRGYRTCGSVKEARRLLEKWTAEARLEKFTRKPPGGIGRPTTACRLGPLGRQRL
jgi:Protein of unknown function (DUF3987)/CHC2 zinc finger